MVAGEVRVCHATSQKRTERKSPALEMSRRWVTGYGLRGSPLSYPLRPLERRWGSPEALSAMGNWQDVPVKKVAGSVRRTHELRCGVVESGSVSVRTRDESIWSHNNAMAPLITPSQAADEGDLRAFLGEL